MFASGLDLPFGIAFYPPGPSPTHIYVAESSRVVRYRYVAGDLGARGTAEVIVPHLPQGAGDLPGRGHWTRDIAFSADGRKMYVSVGSYSNVQADGEDETDRAAILEFCPDGSNRQVFASGLRNPVSLAISPVTGALWATVNERDGLGDELVPDYVTAVWRDQFFGWPWYYHRRSQGPAASQQAAGWPAAGHRPEGAAAGALGEPGRGLLYRNASSRRSMRGNLFVAVHGSWNRANPIGSKVIRIMFDEQGRALPHYEDFMTGFVVSKHEVWGRPVGVTVGTGGALYVSEDARNTIYCVNYTG